MLRGVVPGMLFCTILAVSLSCEQFDEDSDGEFEDETAEERASSCPTFAAPKATGRVQAGAINECSGLATSFGNSGVLWVHNDSGDSARIYALAENGALVATVKVNNASARDWEDMASGPGPGGNGTYLYIADFGDNGKSRSNVQIYRVREPSVKASDRNRSLSVDAERMIVNYPDGRKNAETLLVDPETGELAIVIKGDGTYVYKVGQFSTTAKVAVKIAQINKSRGGVDTATGGDVSHDASYIVVRDYTTTGKLWRRPAGGSLWDAFDSSPCNVTLASGGGGEGVTFAADDSGFFTLNEGANNNIYFMRNTSGPADQCPNDPNKTEPGECGCGVPEGSCNGTKKLYQAEARTATSGCSQASNHVGYTGSGFMDYGGNGTWIEWNNVSASQAGDYKLTFRYAVGGSQRQSAVIVNGSNKGNVGFVNTGSWTSWKTDTKTVALRQGNNTIRVMANTGNGGPNMDSMEVELIGGGPDMITASGENQPREGKEKAFDGKTDTKWLTFADSAWIQYQFGGGASPAVNKYTITSANDYPSRDPRDWRLKGSNNGSTWTTLDTRMSQTFSARFQKKTYNFSNTTGYKIYRLEIVSNLDPPAANSTQLAEIEFIEGGVVDECPGDPNKTKPGQCGCGVPEGTCDGCIDTMVADDKLLPGEHICSQNGKYEFGLTSGGELVLRSNSGILWSAGTFGSSVHLIMQGDGNLVVYKGTLAPWASNTANKSGATLKLENDGRVVIRLGSAVLWSVGGQNSDVVDASTLSKKVMAGYQGWFMTPGDGSGMNWRHWASSTPNPNNITFDMWPDMREYDSDELFGTSFKYSNGQNAGLYSAYNPKTVDRHVKWMKDYGIDGVFVQRFIMEAVHHTKVRDRVLDNVRRASEKYGRVFVNMYDISGGKDATWVNDVKNDWKHLVDDQKVTQSGRYLRHNGRPVLAIWGFGFGDRPGNPSQAAELIKWLTETAPAQYRVTLMGGIDPKWRGQSDWAGVYRSLDIISPWTVGRYADDAGADNWRRKYIEPDLAECRSRGIEYMPVVWPGFSWYNLRNGSDTFNKIKRRGGRFFWRQAYNAIDAGVDMIYVAMFDEVDEATAMFKIAENSSQTPTTGKFLELNDDGEALPSDWYLQLMGEATKMLGRQTNLTPTIPIRP